MDARGKVLKTSHRPFEMYIHTSPVVYIISFVRELTNKDYFGNVAASGKNMAFFF